LLSETCRHVVFSFSKRSRLMSMSLVGRVLGDPCSMLDGDSS
jgi:hypothetical protein